MFLVAFALLFSAGLCMTTAFIGPPWRRPFDTTGLAILFGLGCVPLGVLLTSLLSPTPAIVTVSAFAVLIAGLALLLRQRGAEPSTTPPIHLDRFSRIATWTPITLATGMAAVISARSTLGWDGLFVWEMKARAICLSGGVLPMALFTDRSLVIFHPHYPLLQPLAEAWAYVWTADCNESLTKVVPVAFLLAGCALITGAAATFTGNPAAAVFAAALPLTVPFLFLKEGSASSGYADVCAGAYYLASVALLARWFRSGLRDTRLLLCGSLIAGLLVWSKQEGSLYWCLLLIPTVVMAVAHKKPKAILVWAAPGIVAWSAWRVFLTIHGTTLGFDFLPPSFTNITSNLARIPNLAALLLTELLTWSRWGLLWPAVLVLLVVPTRDTFMGRIWMLWFVILPIVLWTLLYTLSAWNPYVDHVQASLPRLVLQVVPTGLFLVAVRVDGLWSSSNKRIGELLAPRLSNSASSISS